MIKKIKKNGRRRYSRNTRYVYEDRVWFIVLIAGMVLSGCGAETDIVEDYDVDLSDDARVTETERIENTEKNEEIEDAGNEADENTTFAQNEEYLAYKIFLEKAIDSGVIEWKNESVDIVESGDFASYESDTFAIADIDLDGVSELIFNREAASMAGMVQLVYRYDIETDEVVPYFQSGVFDRFYDTGLIVNDSYHSQGLAGDAVWPFTVSILDNGELVDVSSIDGWDKSLGSADYQGNAFPDEVDINGDGYIYYIYNFETQSQRTVDNDEYEKYLATLGNEIEVEYLSLTHENAEKITGCLSNRVTVTDDSLEEELASIEQEEENILARQNSEDVVTQLDLDSVASDRYHLWDDELNSIWARLKETLSEAEMNRLVEEERAWIVYRDEEAEFAGKQAEDERMKPMLYNDRLAEVTKERVYELAAMLVEAQ